MGSFRKVDFHEFMEQSKGLLARLSKAERPMKRKEDEVVDLCLNNLQQDANAEDDGAFSRTLHEVRMDIEHVRKKKRKISFFYYKLQATCRQKLLNQFENYYHKYFHTTQGGSFQYCCQEKMLVYKNDVIYPQTYSYT